MSFQRNIGLLLLSIFLILFGITSLGAGLTIPPMITGLFALVSGIFILIGR